MSSGSLAWMAERHPDAHFTIACGPACAPLFSAMPQLKTLIPLHKKPYHGHWLGLWKHTVGTAWQSVVDIRSSGLAYLLRSGERRIYRPQKHDTRPKAAQIATGLGIAPVPYGKIWFTEEHLRNAESLGRGELRRTVVLCPKANWVGKEWPVEHYAALGRQLHRDLGAVIAVLGTEAQAAAMEPIANALPKSSFLNLCGKTDLLTAAALLSQSMLFIGNDSGMMHLAAATGCPTLGLFGPTNDAVYGPWGKKTAVIRCPEPWDKLFDPKAKESLMSTLDVEDVYQSAMLLAG
ncbi:MAG: glycosyltransferase family 9 protein [Alphaproteobacteria bacterium]|nr:glycosyltransferase family 9 protein [Alphaproteobacteria bacterium]